MLDASFWINADRSGLTRYLLDYFELSTPPMVADELTRSQAPQPRPAQATFVFWRDRGDIRVIAPQTSFERFDAGENEAIALARERDWALLIDDAAPRHFSRGPLRLRVIDSPAFAVFLYDQGRLSYVEAIGALLRSHAGRGMVNEALVVLETLARRRGQGR